jgi:signal transduction histidine kinase
MSTVATEQRRRTEYHRLLPGLLTAEPYGEADRHPRSTRDWIVDVLAFIISLVGILLTWLGQRGGGHAETHYMLIADFVISSVAALSIWLRRRWPVALILVLTPVSVLFQFAGFVSIIAFFTVAVHRRFPIAALITVLQLLSLFPLYVLHPQSGLSYWGAVLVGSIFVVAVLAWGMFVRARRQLLLSLRERAERAEATQQLKVEQAQHLERERIAREMHDVLAHRISLLSLHAGALEFHPDAPPEAIARAAGVIRDSARQALQDLREVIGVLRDGSDGGSPERPQPTLADIPGLVDESRAAGMRVELIETISDPDQLPTGVGRSAYRIVQEGLTNVRKHAPSSLAYVTITGTSGAGLDIEVRNLLPVGRSAASDLPGSGNGIIGLTERVNLAGGQIDCGPTNAGEYRLHTWLPWPAGESA